MQLYHLWACSALLFIIFSRSHSCNDDDYKRPVVAALLDLHSGKNCEVVNFHGLQQLAALRSTMKIINVELLADEIEIDLQVFDSCSTKTGTKIATLKALVAAEQTCINTPFFIGFIGNENRTNYEVSQSITRVFNMAHVLPYTFDSHSKSSDNVHFISTYPVKQHTEAVKILLSKLEIQNILVVYENTDISKMKMDHLLDCFKEDLCIIKTVMFVNSNDLKAQLNRESNEEAVLIISETLDALDDISATFATYGKQIIISSGRVGFENSIFRLKKTAYVLQLASSTNLGNLSKHYDERLVKIYNDQQWLKCSKKMVKFEWKCNSSVISAGRIIDKDWTTDLLQYGLKLYGSSVRAASYEKCKQVGGIQGICSKMKSLPKNEWNNIVKDSSAFVQIKPGSIKEKINFNMNIAGKFNVYLIGDGLIQRIGEIEDSKMELYNYKFPALVRTERHSECVSTVPPTTTTTQSSTDDYQPDATLITIGGFFDFDVRDYELIGVLSGIGFGILLLIGLFIYFIFSTMKVKSNRSDSSIRTKSSD